LEGEQPEISKIGSEVRGSTAENKKKYLEKSRQILLGFFIVEVLQKRLHIVNDAG
jgi:hypothetical protein